uniref:SFRICE_022595 n=1 Tax=Spodoptera frugiperda TaxID=7108 RepID=A0A2H1VWD0_SPOFR
MGLITQIVKSQCTLYSGITDPPQLRMGAMVIYYIILESLYLLKKTASKSVAEEQLMFDSSTEALLQKFLQNNPQTGNLGSLVQVFITRATELLAAPNSDNNL